MTPDLDVLIAGSGPAGTLLAAACARRGLRVAMAGPRPRRPWPQNFGVWADVARDAGLASVLNPVWNTTEIRIDEGRSHLLDRAYGRVDGERLQQGLLSVLDEASHAEVLDAAVHGVDHGATGTEIQLDETRRHARLFVDATGHAARFVERTDTDRTPAYQTAYGVLATLRGRWPTPDRMTLMNFSERGAGVPTFLYAMPYPDGRVFVEETVLVAAPAVPPPDLRGRLEQRMAARGLPIVAVHEVEHCTIPMNAPSPVHGQRTLGFGGAASMVHPCTGYQLGLAMRLAPQVAEAIATGIADDLPAADLSVAGWDAVWSPAARKADALYRFAADFVTGLDLETTRTFFDQFFSLPVSQWSGFVDRTMPVPELEAAMRRMYGGAPGMLRRRLARHALRPSQWGMLWRTRFPRPVRAAAMAGGR